MLRTPNRSMEDLKNQIRYHNYRYYVLNDPVVSDFDYDQALKQLEAIEAQHPDWVTPQTPPANAPVRNPRASSIKWPTPRQSSAWPMPTTPQGPARLV